MWIRTDMATERAWLSSKLTCADGILDRTVPSSILGRETRQSVAKTGATWVVERRSRTDERRGSTTAKFSCVCWNKLNTASTRFRKNMRIVLSLTSPPPLSVDSFINHLKWYETTSTVLYRVYYYLYPKVAFEISYPRVILYSCALNETAHTIKLKRQTKIIKQKCNYNAYNTCEVLQSPSSQIL